MVNGKRFSLVKPNLHTPFHIDFNWWSSNERNWRVYLRSYLPKEDQEKFSDMDGEEEVDLVDPDTAEVQKVDALQHLLITRSASQENFITQTTSIAEAIFRLFLTNGNNPMNSIELADMLGRSPTTILRMLSGPRVYKGIRPCLPNK